MNVVDLGLALVGRAGAAVETGDAPLGEGGGARWSLLTVAPGAKWVSAHVDRARAVLVLAGIASWTVDEERQTLAPGQLLLVEPGAALSVLHDGSDEAVVACVSCR